jgi:hypothetical protein
MTEGNEVEELTNAFQERSPTNNSYKPRNYIYGTARSSKKRKFKNSDRVIVKNKYRGLKGTKGTIISLSNAQATVRPDNNGATFRKYRQNLRRL